MRKVIFLNCTAHELTPEQITAVQQIDGFTREQVEIKNLKDIAPELFTTLTNLQGDESLNFLTFQLEFTIYEEQGTDSDNLTPVFVHLPIGSPAFMFKFAQAIHKEQPINVHFVFSHTKREAMEVTDTQGNKTKTSRFVFEKFIHMP